MRSPNTIVLAVAMTLASMLFACQPGDSDQHSGVDSPLRSSDTRTRDQTGAPLRIEPMATWIRTPQARQRQSQARRRTGRHPGGARSLGRAGSAERRAPRLLHRHPRISDPVRARPRSRGDASSRQRGLSYAGRARGGEAGFGGSLRQPLCADCARGLESTSGAARPQCCARRHIASTRRNAW